MTGRIVVPSSCRECEMETIYGEPTQSQDEGK